MSIMKGLWEDRETREDGADRPGKRDRMKKPSQAERERAGWDGWKKEEVAREAHEAMDASDADRFDFSRSGRPDGGRDGESLSYAQADYEEMRRLMKESKQERMEKEQADLAAQYGMTPEEMHESGMHADGTPFESGYSSLGDSPDVRRALEESGLICGDENDSEREFK